MATKEPKKRSKGSSASKSAYRSPTRRLQLEATALLKELKASHWHNVFVLAHDVTSNAAVHPDKKNQARGRWLSRLSDFLQDARRYLGEHGEVGDLHRLRANVLYQIVSSRFRWNASKGLYGSYDDAGVDKETYRTTHFLADFNSIKTLLRAARNRRPGAARAGQRKQPRARKPTS